MKVFVTGGAGFIGSWIDRVLLREGHQATVYDNLTSGSKEQIPAGAKLIVGDIRDKETLKKAMRDHDAVIHLAAQIIVPESVENPQETFDINLVGAYNVAEVMREIGIKRIVYSSTAAVYGDPVRMPIEEDDPKFPISPYGATKLAFEQILHTYHKNYGFDVVMFRYFNPYGPGENHKPESHAIPNFIRATLKNEEIPLYWGGGQERDFFYVEDIAEAHVLGLQKPGFSYYNLGSGTSTKVIDVLKIIFKIIGHEAPINDLGERPGDSHRLMASINKVKKDLGWSPKTNLQTGLKRTVKFFKQES